MAVGTGEVLTYCAAVEPLDPTDLVDLYWAGRAAFVTTHDQIPVYDRVFRAYYLAQSDDEDEPVPFSLQAKEEARAELQLPESQPGEEHAEREVRLGLAASDVATLKGKSFAACTPEELVALRRIMRTMRLIPPRRRSRRTTGGARGSLARPAAYGPRLDAHPRRPDRAVVAPASHPAAPARADPRRVGLDDRLLPQPAPVRLLRPAGGLAGGGVLLRHPAHAHHPRARAPPARRGAVAGRGGRRRLGRRHPHRGVARRRSCATGAGVGRAAAPSW